MSTYRTVSYAVFCALAIGGPLFAFAQETYSGKACTSEAQNALGARVVDACNGPHAKNLWVIKVAVPVLGPDTPVATYSPDCGAADVHDYPRVATRALAQYYTKDPGLTRTAGDLFYMLSQDTFKEARKHIRGDAGRFIDRNLRSRSKYSSCAPLAVVVPAQGKYRGYRYLAWDGKTAGECLPGAAECQGVGYSNFTGAPTITSVKGGATIISTVFKNWKHKTTTTGSLAVFYTMPAGKKPDVYM